MFVSFSKLKITFTYFRTTDCIHSKLNVTSSSILSTTKGLVHRIADKFAVKFVPNEKENTVSMFLYVIAYCKVKYCHFVNSVVIIL